MDSQERHDLKTNDLQEFFDNFGSFWKAWGNSILTVAAVIVIIFAGAKLYGDWTTSAREASWTDLAGATSPQSADMVAAEHGNPVVKALAFLKAGDLYLGQAGKPAVAEQRAMPVDGGEDPVKVQEQQLLDNAQARYQTVLSLNVPKVYKLNAQLGLASVAEGREQWDEARTLYEQVITEAGDSFASLKKLAQVKSDMLPGLAKPIVFGLDVDAQAEGMTIQSNDPTPAPALAPGTGTAPAPEAAPPGDDANIAAARWAMV